MPILAWLFEKLVLPYLIYIVIAIIAGLGITVWVLKIQHDEKARVLQQVEQEKTQAIMKGKDARARIITICNSNPTLCVPEDWYRD